MEFKKTFSRYTNNNSFDHFVCRDNLDLYYIHVTNGVISFILRRTYTDEQRQDFTEKILNSLPENIDDNLKLLKP